MFEKAIGTINAAASFRHRYDNFIGGRWSAPAGGEYFADTSPINGAQIAEFALSTPEDVERALDAAHAGGGLMGGGGGASGDGALARKVRAAPL